MCFVLRLECLLVVSLIAPSLFLYTSIAPTLIDVHELLPLLYLPRTRNVLRLQGNRSRYFLHPGIPADRPHRQHYHCTRHRRSCIQASPEVRILRPFQTKSTAKPIVRDSPKCLGITLFYHCPFVCRPRVCTEPGYNAYRVRNIRPCRRRQPHKRPIASWYGNVFISSASCGFRGPSSFESLGTPDAAGIPLAFLMPDFSATVCTLQCLSSFNSRALRFHIMLHPI